MREEQADAREVRETARPAFFVKRGDLYDPLALSMSPWNPRHQGGMAIAGLLMHEAEQVPAPVPMITAHVTIDILRATPNAPVECRTSVVREGKRLQMIDVDLLAGGDVVARTRVLRVRQSETPGWPAPMTFPSPEQSPRRPLLEAAGELNDILETRVVCGGLEDVGPGALWARIDADLIAGQPVEGLAALAMIADFGSGISNVLARDLWSFANVDISLHMARTAVGPWFLLASDVLSPGTGVSQVNTVLCDRSGPFGYAHQTLFVAPLEPTSPRRANRP